jgi:hypothetical protein
LEAELNLDPDSNPDPNPDPNLEIISDPDAQHCSAAIGNQEGQQIQPLWNKEKLKNRF